MLISKTLRRRIGEIHGYHADADERQSLLKLLQTYPLWLRTAYDLPICGVLVEFELGSNRTPCCPSAEFMKNYEPTREFSFYWMRPRLVVSELVESRKGALLLSNNIVPIGMCPMGGDNYYVKCDGASGDTPLIRVY